MRTQPWFLTTALVFSIGCQTTPCPAPGEGPIAQFVALEAGSGSEEEAWLSMPHPSDHRLTAEGAPDWSDFPDPYRVDLLDDYLDILGTLDGYGLSAPVFIRFDSPINAALIPSQPAATRRGGDPIQLIDISPDSPEYGQRRPLRWHWWEAPQTYVPSNTLAVAPAWGFPLRESTTYALLLTQDIKGLDGSPIQSPSLLTAVLNGNDTDGCTDAPVGSSLGNAYAPLRDYLALNPELRDTLAAATVFTTQSLSPALEAVYSSVQNSPPSFDPDTLRILGDSGEFWEQKTFKWSSRDTVAYYLFEGRLTVPNYQVGTVPYDRDGQLNLVDGTPTPVFQEDIRFTLTVPTEPPPSGECYPIIEYAHGTTGSAYSMVNSTGGRLAARGLAAISIDMPIHGERNGNRTFDENTASFNFINPDSARSMFRQAAIDTFALTAMVRNSLRIPASHNPSGTDICFDKNKIGYFGHSQGGLSGSIAAAYESGIGAWVFSGAGGGLGITVQERKDFADFEELVKFLLQIPEEETLNELHPVHSVIQTAVEITDPLNYAKLWGEGPVGGTTNAANIMITSGCLDEQTPFRSANALALASKTPLLGPAEVDIPEYQWLDLPYATAPLSNNGPAGSTRGYMQWCGGLTNPELSNHFVIFNRPEAVNASMRFLESWAYEGQPSLERRPDADVR